MPKLRRPVLTGAEASRADGAAPASPEGSRPKVANLLTLWGRRSRVSAVSGLLSLVFTLSTQAFVLFAQACLDDFGGSISAGARELLFSPASPPPVAIFRKYFPAISAGGGGPAAGYLAWILVQALLYTALPGRLVHGNPTPSGARLPYRMNGLASWFVTIGVWLCVAYFKGAEAAASPARHFATLLVLASVYGLGVAALALIKGHVAPSNAMDRRLSGSVFHDFLAGVELNPRLGQHWDLKLFQIGRLGMNSWVIVDLSFLAQQYSRFGAVSYSMVGVTVLHTIYVVDFFVNEEWYLSTIDIAHDHFGFYLGWGSAVWLPFVYTIQTQYLASHFVELSLFRFGAIMTVGVLSYGLFRLANYQKYSLRRDGRTSGLSHRVINAEYTTADGKLHKSNLLCSGCWGFTRHPNYTGDIIFSFCVCAFCGWSHLLPYSYFIWMASLLIHRCYRDEKRCSAKYGAYWDEYQRLVPWRLIPGIF